MRGEVWLDNYSTTSKTTSFLVYGAQLELGAYATSYIPTTTASVTRNVDSGSKTAISSLIGSTQGTLFSDFVLATPDNARITLDDGSTDNRIFLFTSTGGIGFSVVASNVFIATIVGSSATLGTRYKVAFAYKNSDFVLYINGIQIGSQSSGTLTGTFSRLGFDSGFSTGYFNNKVNSLAHWKTRLTNSELAQLTTL